jgi:alanine dehydrogenase
MMKLRVLSGADVRQAITMSETIEIIAQAFAQLSAGQAIVPDRIALSVERHNGVPLFMPAYLAESDDLGIKIAAVYPNNLQSGMPTIFAIVVVLEASTGRPVAIMDGTYLTALRTGAASGVATRLLARRDAHVVAIFGAGAQGRTQLQGVCEVRDIQRAWVFDLRSEATIRYVSEMSAMGGRIPADVRAAGNPAQAVRDADIICTATTSGQPVFNDGDLRPGVHINAIGSYTPKTREIPGETIARAKVVTDSLSAVLADGAGDLSVPIREGLITTDHVHADLGEVVMGVKAGRESNDEVTVFKAVGNAVQDVSVAGEIMRVASERDLGIEVEI